MENMYGLTYAARMKAEINKPLYASVSGKGNLAIVRQINPRYDANKSRYEINVPLDLMSTYKWVLTIVESTTATSNYLGQNAYGATRQVSEEVTQTVALHSTKNRIGESTHFINFPISPIEAKKLDGHQLAFVYIGKIADPYYAEDTYHASPTINNPVDRKTYFTIIGFELDETWLLDLQTGKIISKKIKIPL